jgi:hypothetical protein
MINIKCNRRGCNSLKLEHSKLCEKCYLKQKSVQQLGSVHYWSALKELLVNQNYICPYTGNVLVLGLNTSLDHIVSKKLDKDKANDITNVQWVDFQVNMAKSHLTHQQFIDFCKQITDYQIKKNT